MDEGRRSSGAIVVAIRPGPALLLGVRALALAVGIGGALISSPLVPTSSHTLAAGIVAISVLAALAHLSGRTTIGWLLDVGVAFAITAGQGMGSAFALAVSLPLLAPAINRRHTHLLVAVMAIALGMTAGLALRGADLTARDVNLAAALLLGPLAIALLLAGAPTRQARLSVREEDLELARLLSAGMTYARVAEALNVSEETVKVRVARLYRRVGASNRREMIAMIGHGLAEDNPSLATWRD